MLALLYLALAIALGWVSCERVLRRVLPPSKLITAYGAEVDLSGWLILGPAAFLTGTTMLTWITFLTLYVVRGSSAPREIANAVSCSIALAACVLLWKRRQHVPLPLRRVDAVFAVASVAISYAWYQAQVRMEGDVLQIAWSVWMDMGNHLSIARSFSQGFNMPPQYPHYPGDGINYHFLLYFLVGNLEWLGLSLAGALNIPSALGLASLFMMIYALGTIVSGRRLVGLLAVIFFLFRSSWAFFTWWAHLGWPGPQALIQQIGSHTNYIGDTPYESWGIWTVGVLANVRHMPYVLAFVLLVIIYLWPLIVRMQKPLRADWGGAVFMGTNLGLLGFWEGASVISMVVMLGWLALVMPSRKEPVLMAAITLILCSLEENAFTSSTHSPLSIAFHFGMLSGATEPLGLLFYYLQLLGVMPFLVVASLWGGTPILRRMLVASLTPLIFANFVQVSHHPIIAHRLIALSFTLLDIFAAIPLVWLLERRKPVGLAAFGLLTFLMTVSGIVDAVLVTNNTHMYVPQDLGQPLARWARTTNPNDVFLIEPAAHHPVLLSGRRVFVGRPYFAWSTGYDVDSRMQILVAIYTAHDAAAIRQMAHDNGIAYIVIEDANRTSKLYKLDEAAWQGLDKVFEDPERHITVYRP